MAASCRPCPLASVSAWQHLRQATAAWTPHALYITLREAKSPLAEGFEISWDQHRGKKAWLFKCMQSPRKDQKIQHSVLLPCNRKCLLKLSPTKLPIENSSEPPRNQFSEGHHPLQLWWKHSAYSTAGSQVAALKTSVLGNTHRGITSITWPLPEAAQTEGGRGLTLLCFFY